MVDASTIVLGDIHRSNRRRGKPGKERSGLAPRSKERRLIGSLVVHHLHAVL